MRKTLLKRILCGTLAAAMTLSFAGCGKKSEPEVASKENMYSSEVFNISGFDSINSMTASGDTIYIVGYKSYTVTGNMEKQALGMAIPVETAVIVETEEVVDDSFDIGVDEPIDEAEEVQYFQQLCLASYDFDGNKIAEKVIYDSQENEGGWTDISSMFVSGDKICILKRAYFWNDETGESTEDYDIERYTKDLSLDSIVSLNDIKNNYDDADSFYIGSYVEDNNGNGYILVNNDVMVINSEGKFLFTAKYDSETESSNGGSYISSIVCGKNGDVYVFGNRYSFTDDNYESTNFARIVDLENKSLGEEKKISISPYGSPGSTPDYDMTYNSGTKLYGYNIETDEKTLLIDWITSGIDSTAIEEVIVAPNGRIVYSSYDYQIEGGGYSYSSDDRVINILTKRDPSEIPDKELITVYTTYLNYDIRSKISEFNRNSEKYQIEVTAYEDEDYSDYDSCLKRLNNDLVAGKLPDILIVDSNMPFNSYVSKGLIADLNEFMEKDESLSREDYLENVLEALSVGGKLYRITPSFNISTFAAKKSIVGDKTSWTMDDFIKVAEENPDSEMFLEMTSASFVQIMLLYNMEQFVNSETGECSFNSDSFKKILEFSKNFPQEINYDELYSDDNYWMEREASYRDGKAILKSEYLYDFRTLKRDEAADFGEAVTFIGVPSETGNGSTIQLSTSLAITAKAKNPDGAWEFIKTLLSDEAQANVSGYPVKLSAFNALAEKAKEKPYWEDENGNKEYYDDIYWIADQSIVIEPNTDEDNERIISFIKSVTNVYSYDTDLFNIVDEEVQAYFSGQKSVDEVVDIIQNRASTYISESR